MDYSTYDNIKHSDVTFILIIKLYFNDYRHFDNHFCLSKDCLEKNYLS